MIRNCMKESSHDGGEVMWSKMLLLFSPGEALDFTSLRDAPS